MPRNLIGAIVIIIGLVSLLFFGYVVFFNKEQSVEHVITEEAAIWKKEPEKTEKQEFQKKDLPKKQKRTIVIESSEKAESIEEVFLNKIEVERLAGNFIERYGSYSSQANYANLHDSMLYMTDAMKERVLRSIKASKARKEVDRTVYKSVAIRAVARKLINYNKGDIRARVLVGAIQSEVLGDKEVASRNRNVEVHLVKVGKTWKVENVIWQ